MADVQVQAVEPDPSATSLPNDSQTITEKTVEIAKEPTIDSAEEVTKVQEAKESKDAGGENVIGEQVMSVFFVNFMLIVTRCEQCS